jgi:hypothetical protein
VGGPAQTTPDKTTGYFGSRHLAVLFAADTVPPYVRLYQSAAKVPAEQIPPTVADPRFQVDRVVLFEDSAAVAVERLVAPLPPAPSPPPTVARWEPGRIEVTLRGGETKQGYVVVAENWYKDWHATADGKDVPVLRANYTMLSAAVPPGAKNLVFEVRSPAYERGRLITLASALGLVGLMAVPLVLRQRSSNG